MCPGVSERGQCHVSQLHLVSVMQDSIDRMFLSAGPDALKRRNVFSHRHDLRAGLLLDERVAFHVVAVGMTAEDDLDVFESESEFGHRVADHGIVSLVVRVDEDVPLRCCHQKRSERFRADVVDVADDLVRRELLVLLLRRSDVAREEFGNSPDARRLSSEENWRRNACQDQQSDSFLKSHVQGLYGLDAALTIAFSVGMSFTSGELLLKVRM